MKKNYMIIALLTIASFAKAQFVEYTNHRGAFGAANTKDWTENWAEFDPQYKVYPSTNKTVQADITTNTTWSSGDVILLKNKVYVSNNATLTIQAGCVIRGDKATEGTLIISRGSKIIAEGSELNPIVFTSNFDTASREVGDWGGLVLCGRAPMNQGTAVIEGGLDTAKARYGGVDPNDNSGILKYVRIEFAGFPFQPDKEINGLTFGAIGRGTTVDYVQCSYTNDDSFEWFGGTVNCKHLIAFAGVDDDFDTDFGYSGIVQYGLIIRDPDYTDQSGGSTSEGFESDNDGAGSSLTPMTTAVFTNITMVGPYRGNTSIALPANADFKRCIRIRKNSGISILNSIFSNFPTGVSIEGTGCEDNATGDTIHFKNNTFASILNNNITSVVTGSSFDIATWFSSNNNDSYTSTTSINWVNPYPELYERPDYRLNANSPMMATNATNFTDPKLGQVIFDVNVKEIQSDNSLRVYPNPANQIIAVEINAEATSNSQFIITDITGKSVLTSNLETNKGINTQTINVEGLDAGIYFLQINLSGVQHIQKFVKQ